MSFQSYLEHIRSLAKEAGVDSLPIWITEAGFISQSANASGRTDQGSPEKQAAWLVESFEHALKSGVERIYWLLVRDRSEPYFGSMGLIDESDHFKPAWKTFAKFLEK